MGHQGSGQMHPSLNQQFKELGYWLLQDWCYILVFNDGVGADYVQKEKVVPRGIGSNDVGLRCARLDGDADRLVYFSVSTNSSRKFDLVDGDKILSLFALFIKDQPSILAKDGNEKPNNNSQARLGVVQTAYANGASADYLKQLGLEVIFTPTGVKHLH
ncbi:phosphoacetylglucosamine mutase-like [Gossypium raimondii]|uniref:phosphoacetylglucosamine mutase-like n=1 Tax=Gossypium raimondii TaxID=29730 RepID=UPI00227B01F9|nr:phosphoacetylglucosamine mutase-like [Gossypium raimondii]